MTSMPFLSKIFGRPAVSHKWGLFRLSGTVGIGLHFLGGGTFIRHDESLERKFSGRKLGQENVARVTR